MKGLAQGRGALNGGARRETCSRSDPTGTWGAGASRRSQPSEAGTAGAGAVAKRDAARSGVVPARPSVVPAPSNSSCGPGVGSRSWTASCPAPFFVQYIHTSRACTCSRSFCYKLHTSACVRRRRLAGAREESVCPWHPHPSIPPSPVSCACSPSPSSWH